jgi:tRNA(Ile)-lysidine synthase
VPAAPDGVIGETEASALFDDLAAEPALVLAVSGGPDSTALLHLMARWRDKLRPPPRLVAVTVDHGLRPEAKGEAAAVKRLSETLGVEHVTMRWTGAKPSTGIQEAARLARYGLLRTAARRARARCVVTAHTLDDQAETVLFRMARGSGLTGLCGMARQIAIESFAIDSPIGSHDGPAGRLRSRRASAATGRADPVMLVRPLLEVPKARLIVTLRQAGIAYAEDPSNLDPRYTRTRLRRLMPALAAEGLTSRSLARLAARVRRSEAAHEAIASWAAERLFLGDESRKVVVSSADWRAFPDEIALRLLGRSIGAIGTEGPVELGKLEALHDALSAALAGDATRFRRTLAGAMVSLQRGCIVVEQAPARRASASSATPRKSGVSAAAPRAGASSRPSARPGSKPGS